MTDYSKKDEITLSEIIINISKKFSNLLILTGGIFIIILAIVATQVVIKIPTSHLILEIKSNNSLDNDLTTNEKIGQKNINTNVTDYLTIENLETALKKAQLNDYSSLQLIRHISITPASRGVSSLKKYFNENQKTILKDLTVDVNQIEIISNKLLNEANSRYEIQIDIGRSNINVADASRIINNLFTVINSKIESNFKTSKSKLKIFSLLSDDVSYITVLGRLNDLDNTIKNLKTNYTSYAPKININDMISIYNNINNDTRILASNDKLMRDTLAINQIKTAGLYQKKIDTINQILGGIKNDINDENGSNIVYEVGKAGDAEFDTSFFETLFSIGRKIDLTELRVRLINERKDLEFKKIEIETIDNFYNSKLGITDDDFNITLIEKISDDLNFLTKQVNNYIEIINENENSFDYFSISSPTILEEGPSVNYSTAQILLLFLFSLILSSAIIYVKAIINRV
jgi:hypothetical protein